MIDSFWLQGMLAGHKNALDCIKAFSETDFTEDLKKFDVPTLILHGDDDQIVPIGAAALASAKLVKNATLKVYPGAPHGLTDTHKDQLNADLLAFLKAEVACWRRSPTGAADAAARRRRLDSERWAAVGRAPCQLNPENANSVGTHDQRVDAERMPTQGTQGEVR